MIYLFLGRKGKKKTFTQQLIFSFIANWKLLPVSENFFQVSRLIKWFTKKEFQVKQDRFVLPDLALNCHVVTNVRRKNIVWCKNAKYFILNFRSLRLPQKIKFVNYFNTCVCQGTLEASFYPRALKNKQKTMEDVLSDFQINVITASKFIS